MMHVPSRGGVQDLPALVVDYEHVAKMAKVLAPFFECVQISCKSSFTFHPRRDVFYPHLMGKLTRFPIEFFSLATNPPCFREGDETPVVRHFGFSERAANKIA
eukprot:jgi/Tetstr1/420346/TSEL_011466.t1